MTIQDLLTTAGLLMAIMAIVQWIKLKLVQPKISKRYQKFVVILSVPTIGFALGFIAFFLNTVFVWIPDITAGDVCIRVCEASFTAIVINQIWKGASNVRNGTK